MTDEILVSRDDAVEVVGLSAVLEEEAVEPTYLELRLRSHGREFQAAVLLAGDEWALNVRDEAGRLCPGSGEMYVTQSGAVLAAMLTALESSREQ